MKQKLITLAILLYAFSFQACSNTLTNLGEAKRSLKKYYESGAYEVDMQKIINESISELKDLKPGEKDAVVFDVDETVLSNYEHIKSVDFGYVPQLWDKWIAQASAPAVPQVKNLYNFLVKKGIHIIFITGRGAQHYEATYQNLIKEGFTKFDTLIVRPNLPDSKSTAQDYKNLERKMLAWRGYKIIACVGDQYSDMKGENVGLEIKLPNYIYLID